IEFDPFASPWRPHTGRDRNDRLPNPARENIDLRAWLDRQEKRLTEAALAATGGHQGKAAEKLGLSYDQLRGIIRKHGIGCRSEAGEQDA
ncbi:MAG TPA: helix-turn-helix domain-containing protein, partial [Wenzhouxiangella sp.]|nr:helix-turn-helix domain-containing protein [Wenzhouxiangella sp.]